MKVWHLTTLLALICLGSAVSFVVRNPDEQFGPEVFGGCVGFVAMAVVTVILLRADTLNVRLDRSGPVRPQEDPPVPQGTPWTLDQIASVLALHVEPMNGVVFADERTGTIRVMIDPPTAITATTERDRNDAEEHDTSGPSFVGRWTQIEMRRGRLPEVTFKDTSTTARLSDDGRLVPGWTRWTLGHGDRAHRVGGVLAGQGPPASFRYDSRELCAAIDSTAIRAGWVTAAEVAGRPVDPKARHETRTVERTATNSTFFSSIGSGAAPPSAEELQARLEAARNRSAPIRQQHDVKVSTIMGLVGGGILAGCLIGTILGLIFGMPWWASFIIIGSGLLFCVLFVLPVWLLFGTPWRAKTEAFGKVLDQGQR